MVVASAPGKLILFGEHAVVFGEPALSVAINLRTTIQASPSERNEVNGHPLTREAYPYLEAALRKSPSRASLALRVLSDIPEASGMGSSAAVTVCLLACLGDPREPLHRESIARLGFEVEREVQGRASPIDTTTATQGGGILLLKERGENFLWRIKKDDSAWYLHSCTLPELSLVVGSTGIEAATGPLVARVKELYRMEEAARHAIHRIGEISLEGMRALAEGDLTAAGELMQENHALLNSLQVGHPLLDRFVEASLPYSYGAKLTGAGGGGSMIALSDRPRRVKEAIEACGGEAFIVSTEPRGVVLEPGD
ncbi:MAG: mevalonate kinase [Thermoplasmata archaeon]